MDLKDRGRREALMGQPSTVKGDLGQDLAPRAGQTARDHLSHCSEPSSRFSRPGPRPSDSAKPWRSAAGLACRASIITDTVHCYLYIVLNQQSHWERDRKTKQWLQIRHSHPTQEGHYRTRGELLAPRRQAPSLRDACLPQGQEAGQRTPARMDKR